MYYPNILCEKISSLISFRSHLFKQIFRSAIRKQKAPNGFLTPLEETLRWSFVKFYILHAYCNTWFDTKRWTTIAMLQLQLVRHVRQTQISKPTLNLSFIILHNQSYPICCFYLFPIFHLEKIYEIFLSLCPKLSPRLLREWHGSGESPLPL